MTIPVFYIGSEGLADIMSVSMVSMLSNTKSDIVIRVLDCGMGSFSKHIISNMCMKYESCKSIEFIQIDIEKEFADFPDYHGYRDTYARLLIPRLCPEFDRILYIDGDTVVVGDILELWNEDLKDKAIGATLDYYCWRHSDLNINKDSYYFSAGVMIMDLKKLREMNFERLFRTIDARHKNSFILAEQDTLNLIFKDNNFTLLSRRYNNINVNITQRNEIFSDIFSELNAIPDDLLIAHFAWKKPWRGRESTETSNSELWWRYATMSPYFESLWARNCIALSN